MGEHGSSRRSHAGSGQRGRVAGVGIGALLLAMLALSGVAPALASAEVGWQMNSSPLTEKTATTWKGTITLSTKALGYTVAAECTDTAEGVSGFNGAGEVTKWTSSSCTPVAGTKCEKGTTPALEPENLPWHTELALVEGAIHDVLVSSGKGTPGFTLKCRFLGGIIEDKCTGNIGLSTSNTESGVTAAFSAAEKPKCIEEGTTLEGSQGLTATHGGKLGAAVEKTLEWNANGKPITSAKATSLKGTVKLVATVTGIGEVGVQCNDSGSASSGKGAAGEVGTLTLSECTTVSHTECEGAGASLEARYLPWTTTLARVEGLIADEVTGTAGFKLKCKALGAEVTDECLTIPGLTITNTNTGVSEAFRDEGISCSEGPAGSGHLSGTQTLTLNDGEVLEAI